MRDWWYAWLVFLAVNTLWILASATLILAPPALFGLFYAANEAAHRRGAGVDDFIQGTRRYFFKSWQWGAVNLIAALLVWVNLNFYAQFAEGWSAALLLVTLLLAAFWIVIQAYTLPYLMGKRLFCTMRFTASLLI